ncbi:MAG: hypothetical protein WBQ37_10960 [Candidatus Competibacter sp.]
MAEQADYQVVLQEILAKAKAAAVRAGTNDDYQRGLRMAYYDILSFARDQGEVFGLSAVDLGLEDFDPQELLVEAGTQPHRHAA